MWCYRRRIKSITERLCDEYNCLNKSENWKQDESEQRRIKYISYQVRNNGVFMLVVEGTNLSEAHQGKKKIEVSNYEFTAQVRNFLLILLKFNKLY